MAGRPKRRAESYRLSGMAPGLTGIGKGVVRGHKIDAGTVFTGHDLEGIDLRGAFLFRADFFETECAGADFRGAELGNAYFRAAGLRGADFRGANIKRADFYEADLYGAKFDESTQMEGVSWIGANLDPKQDANTIKLIKRSFQRTLDELQDIDRDALNDAARARRWAKQDKQRSDDE